ncbi:YfdX family protein [Saccharibacter sp. 17.LH.SD]|uniref:YfdX family protein n=1 Tax=Saccharibacter sp. 17.LH.SD TaxID=2689393 RepID=UPI00136904E6|nr:YfdX family protein [Saccharibacter sp. 17.LH.SD]MXV44915.1 YfdX family protein [Saccharibacter sp. 17.LH.SD]
MYSTSSSLRLLASSILIGSLSLAPAFAADTDTQPAAPASHHGIHPLKSVKEHWDRYKAHQAFHHLSEHGQKAFMKILDAQQVLAAGQTDAAIPLLTAASMHLSEAVTANEQFTAAETALHPAPQHPLSPNHIAQVSPTDWVPVGAEIIASDTLAPEKKAAVATANAQLKAGQTQQAAQTLQVVSQDIDFIVALAPLFPTQGAVNRALVFAQGHNAKGAAAALNDVINSLVFVSENVITEATTSAMGQPDQTPSGQAASPKNK